MFITFHRLHTRHNTYILLVFLCKEAIEYGEKNDVEKVICKNLSFVSLLNKKKVISFVCHIRKSGCYLKDGKSKL